MPDVSRHFVEQALLNVWNSDITFIVRQW